VQAAEQVAWAKPVHYRIAIYIQGLEKRVILSVTAHRAGQKI
jgi:hypothetical protein